MVPSRKVCLSQIKSEHIGDAARPGLEDEEYGLLSELCAIGVPVGNLIRLATRPNRAMLRPYERSLQPGLVGAGRIVPIAGRHVD